ncbi:MAG: 4Fe-4S dicluster domain-containing protein [Chloroflexi bacterium]|nr:4Fe-4S dicluster domain-containing protein [Chloroflexota bacterium]
MEESREIFWNIGSSGHILYYLLIPLAAILAYAVYRRYRLWRLGRPDNRLSDLGKSLRAFIVTGIVDGLIHRRFLREPYPGLMHFLIFWGAIVFLLGAATDFVTHYLIGGLEGKPYLGASFVVDVLGLAVLVGLGIAVYRRYIQRPDRLDNKPEDAIALSLIFVIVLTGFIIEGLRIAALDPDWGAWSPGGWVMAQIFGGLSVGTLETIHKSLWWFHVGLALGAIVYVALTFSSLAHIVVSPFNVLFRSLRPKGALAPIDLETAEVYGAAKIDDFTWKHLLDLDSCTRCGRCQDVCPAYLSGKALSPKKVIQDLKQHWLEMSPSLLAAKAGGGNEGNPGNPGENSASMIGDVITTEVIWDCTTCRACMEVCPVFIEHIDKIIDMRRNLVLEQAEIPETSEMVLRCIEDRGHTCRGTTYTRGDWCVPLGLPSIAEDKDVDIVYWVGCASSLEDRSIKIAVALANVLKAAGVKVGVMSEDETCCGEPARRMGNEYLFQMQVQKNIEAFNKHGIKKILVSCPHCYNTFKNEYPQFGGEIEVVHHSQFIADLIRQGRLKLTNGLEQIVTYHDACYLGRHNDIYDSPREVVKGIPQVRMVEMERNRRRSFCCGGGGGHFWIEEREGVRISEMRIEQALKTNAGILATACPYCLQMFEDAIKAKEATESLKSMDIAELVESAIQK